MKDLVIIKFERTPHTSADSAVGIGMERDHLKVHFQNVMAGTIPSMLKSQASDILSDFLSEEIDGLRLEVLNKSGIAYNAAALTTVVLQYFHQMQWVLDMDTVSEIKVDRVDQVRDNDQNTGKHYLMISAD